MKSEVRENKVDFSLIRYSQCWEDTEILLSALDIKEGDICLGIASAGDNILSMLTGNPARVIAIDISIPQLSLIKLKIEAIRMLSYRELLLFLGVTDGDREKRIRIYERIREGLDESSREYWDFNKESIGEGINHIGKFEKFFSLFRKRILPFVHSEKRIKELLEDRPYTERKEFYNRKWCSLRWKLIFKIFFSNYVVGKLGRDKEFFRYVEKDIAKTMLKRSEYALCELNPHENPYISYILTGNYDISHLPYFLREENIRLIKENLHKVEIVEGSLEEYLNNTDLKVNKFNLSDIFEYMSLENYEKLMDKIYEDSENGALLAYWNLVVPRNSEIDDSGKGKYMRLSHIDSSLHKIDRTFFYTDFVIEKVVKDGHI